MREPVSSAERLVLTLRFLASGDLQQSLCFSFRISRAAICTILSKTCEKFWEVLALSYIRAQSIVLEWKKISNKCFDMGDVPHCIDEIDDKHSSIKCPANSGSLYYNYKGFFSLVLLAICDAKYKFTLIGIGSYGSNNDCGILAKSLFDDIKMNLPSAEDLAGFPRNPLNYFLAGDEIFPLKAWLLRRHPGNLTNSQKVFNYRLSKSRHTIENTFGILASRWRIFRRPIKAKVENAQRNSLAAIGLHNYLQQTYNAYCCPTGFIYSENSNDSIKEGFWRDNIRSEGVAGLQEIENVRGSRYQQNALEQRKVLKDYFINESTISWQLEHVQNCGPVLQH